MSKAKQKFRENGKNMDAYEGFLPEEEKPSRQHYQKRNNNNKKPAKMKPITYTKTITDEDSSETTPLQAMIDLLAESCTPIYEFVNSVKTNYDGIDLTTFDGIVFGFLCQFTDHNAPQLESKINIHSSINVTSNKITVRLEGGVAFGLEARYTIVDRKAVVTSIIGTVTLYNPNDDLVSYLEEYGFEQFVRQQRK